MRNTPPERTNAKAPRGALYVTLTQVVSLLFLRSVAPMLGASFEILDLTFGLPEHAARTLLHESCESPPRRHLGVMADKFSCPRTDRMPELSSRERGFKTRSTYFTDSPPPPPRARYSTPHLAAWLCPDMAGAEPFLSCMPLHLQGPSSAHSPPLASWLPGVPHGTNKHSDPSCHFRPLCPRASSAHPAHAAFL